MKLSFIFLFVLLMLSFTYGQPVVPLSIGNKWIYSINGNLNNLGIYEIVSDTIISGQKFSKIKYTEGTDISYEYWRADSNQFYINSHFLFASGVKYDRDSTKWKEEDIESSYMDFLKFKNRKVQKVYTDYYMSQHFWNYTYITAKDFGPVGIDFDYSDDVLQEYYSESYVIKGAVISGIIYGDTTILPPPPPKPEAPQLTGIAGNNMLELKWNKYKGNDFKAYNIFELVSRIGGVYNSLLKSITDVNDTTFLVTGLTNEKTYVFKMNVVDSIAGTSDFSSFEYLIPTAFSKASAITGIFALDYDNNGFIDILSSQGSNYELYKNNAGVFLNTGIDFPILRGGYVSWADYNNDGFYDIFNFGEETESGSNISRILKNESGKFKEISTQIAGVVAGSIDWGDYDNDGDLDFVLTGDPKGPYNIVYGIPEDTTVRITKLYRNDGKGVFTPVDSNFPGIVYGSASWGDYNNDGKEDLLLCGWDFIKIYENIKGNFKEIFNFKSYRNKGAWGDFNNDGLLDFCVFSEDSYTQNPFNSKLKIFYNIGNNSFRIATIASYLPYSYAIPYLYCRDYNNDGNLDIILPGGNTIFQNNNDSGFKCISPPATLSFADYNNDGYLDIMGPQGIYKNNSFESFYPARKLNPPINLSAEVLPDHSVKFSWDTTSQVLSYNLRIGTKPDGIDILSPMSNLVTGKRLKLAIGNAGFLTTKTIDNLPEGTYYWSVQSVNNNFDASFFAKEQELKVSYKETNIPSEFSLKQNYPNPFNPSTTIKYSIPKAEKVILKIYDILGRQITTLVNKEKPVGNYSVEFNGSNLPSGVYFYQIRASVFTETRKMLLLK